MQNISYSPLLRVILAATAGLALTTPGLAQNRDSTAQGTAPDPAGVPTKQLQEVTVVGTVDALQSLDFYAPNSSAVLGREELDALGANDVVNPAALQKGSPIYGMPILEA